MNAAANADIAVIPVGLAFEEAYRRKPEIAKFLRQVATDVSVDFNSRNMY